MTTRDFRTAAAILLCAGLLAAGMPGRAQASDVLPVEQWSVYGARHQAVLDSAVPGGGAVRVDARTRLAQAWSSAASVTLGRSLKAGDVVTAVFWVRADRPIKLPVALLARTEPYAAFAELVTEVGPGWKPVVVTGKAPADLAAHSQALSVHLGAAAAQVGLGPVAWMAGRPGAKEIDAVFAAFHPPGVSQDLEVPAENGVVLAATLRLPRGRGQGPYPATLLLAGGGASKRGLYSLLAERLLAKGIATFEYDKRGVGASTGQFDDAIPLIQGDAKAALAYLRRRPEIDGARIAVLGLSQGGVIASALAARDTGVAAVVSLAAPVANAQPFMEGLRERVAASGASREQVARVATAVEDWMKARSEMREPAEIARLREGAVASFEAGGASREQALGMIGVLDTPALLSMFEASPAADLAKVRVPVLALFAAEDEVLSKDSVQAARAALKGKERVEVVVVKGVNHGFQLPPDAASGTPRLPVSAPEVLERVPNWLAERLIP